MTMRLLTLLALAAAASAAGCTLDQVTPPALTGPSDYATTLIVTATPDTVVLNGQQSIVMVEARGATGAPLPNLGVRLDTFVKGLPASCGKLTLRNLTTGSDGRTATVFTAPKLPLPMPECANLDSEGVTIVATPVGTNAEAAQSFRATIRLVTPDSSLPSGAFVVSFTITPNPAKVNQVITFTDTGSESPGHTIDSRRWSFGDGSPDKFGASVVHDYGTAGTYTVTLTVTDDIGQSAFKSALVIVNP